MLERELPQAKNKKRRPKIFVFLFDYDHRTDRSVELLDQYNCVPPAPDPNRKSASYSEQRRASTVIAAAAKGTASAGASGGGSCSAAGGLCAPD